MRRLLLPFATVALLVIAACSWFAAGARAQQSSEAPQNSEFAGKIVTVYLTNVDPEHGQILTDVEFKEISGRMMLVGTGADTGHPENWTRGLRIGIAWERVESYYAMTPEQFEAGVKEMEEGKF